MQVPDPVEIDPVPEQTCCPGERSDLVVVIRTLFEGGTRIEYRCHRMREVRSETGDVDAVTVAAFTEGVRWIRAKSPVCPFLL